MSVFSVLKKNDCGFMAVVAINRRQPYLDISRLLLLLSLYSIVIQKLTMDNDEM